MARYALRATPAAPSKARETVRELLVAWGYPELCDTAMLLTSELVTNAVRHAGTRVHLLVQRLPAGGIRLAVSDAAPGDWPQVNKPGVDQESGRGMWLVDKLSNSWGTTRGRSGKTVWFELLVEPAVVEEGA